MTLMYLGSQPCHCVASAHAPRLVALTGGPGAGKTAVLEMARRCFCAHVAILPEAAGVVFGGGFPRHESDAGRRAAQRAIFHIQREVETLVIEEGRVSVALCDRGTVDGVAYWPAAPATYWDAVGTTEERELGRYRAVIHLRTPSAEQGYDHSNALRIESAREAQRLDARILKAWSAHPHRHVVESAVDFLDKAVRALALVRAELSPCCHHHEIP
jgi:predicted ATPase